MKKRCYSKYSYISYIILAIIAILLSFIPVLIKTDEGIAIKLIWGAVMLSLGVVFMFLGIHLMQYYYFENGNLIVKSVFGTIVKLNIENVQAYIETLPTYFSRGASTDKKWICIYDKSISDNLMYRFKSGCSNKKKFKRIQIIFSEDNLETIEKYIKVNH